MPAPCGRRHRERRGWLLARFPGRWRSWSARSAVLLPSTATSILLNIMGISSKVLNPSDSTETDLQWSGISAGSAAGPVGNVCVFRCPVTISDDSRMMYRRLTPLDADQARWSNRLSVSTARDRLDFVLDPPSLNGGPARTRADVLRTPRLVKGPRCSLDARQGRIAAGSASYGRYVPQTATKTEDVMATRSMADRRRADVLAWD